MKSRIEKSIASLHINGMNGRMLRLAAQKGVKNREILLLYGHHSSLERMAGIAEVLNEYGAVTMPDLPGFGGMDSFYKIGEKPNIDSFADYLAAFMKLQYKRRRVTIICMSFSVPLVVKTLQKYPELGKKVDGFISISGFVRHDDFIFTRFERIGLRVLSFVGARKVPAALMKAICLNKPVLKLAYGSVQGRHNKMKDAKNKDELKRRIEFEANLWRINDVRTRMSTIGMMLGIDVCGSKVNVPAYHVTATTDRYFDHQIVEQHMRIIFDDLEIIPSEMANHAPTIIATAKEAAPYIPKKLRKILA